MYQLFPSKAWEVYISLQVLQQSSRYAPNTTRRPTQLWGAASAQSLLTEWPTAPSLEEAASWIQSLRAGSLRLPQGLRADRKSVV